HNASSSRILWFWQGVRLHVQANSRFGRDGRDGKTPSSHVRYTWDTRRYSSLVMLVAVTRR
ncbi:MAG: hypothetical protein ABIF82_05830, partial [Planctomycetota bacterium]